MMSTQTPTPAQEAAAILSGFMAGYDEAQRKYGPDPLSPVDAFLRDVKAELARAREKFSGPNVTTLALVEEVGELATAVFAESRARVREEAVQVATMAARVALDGDSTLDDWRARKGLDPLVDSPTPAADVKVEAHGNSRQLDGTPWPFIERLAEWHGRPGSGAQNAIAAALLQLREALRDA